jgi:HEAT repeat protein
MKEQVDLLKANGDVQGLVRFFLDQKVPDGGVKQRGPVLMAKGAAATALAEIGTPEALDALIQALEGSPEPQSYMLADALAKFGSPKAVEALVRMAREHDSPQVRHGAAGALAAHVEDFAGRRKDLFDVLDSALDDPEHLVRYNVARLLRAKDPRVVDLLIRALADPHHMVREQAANGLRFREEPQAAEALRALVNDPSERIRSIAAGSGAPVPTSATSGTQAVAGGVAAVIGGVIGAALGTLVGVGIQMAFAIEGRYYLAFLAIGAVAGAAGGRGLVAWNRDRGLPKVQDLKQAGDVDGLLQAFRESGPVRRSKAMKALVELKDPRSVEPLIEALSNPDKEVRQKAAQTLGDLGDPRAIEPLRAAEGSSDQMVRLMAGAALRKLEGS